MVFNSVVFLFCFLPLALLVYYLVPGKGKNAVLLLESLIFYCWTGITWLPLIAVLIAVNYLAGLFLGRRKGGGRKLVLVLAVVVSAAALIFFKYTNFLIDTLNQIAGLGLSSLSFLSVLPLGISYYIFKLISYVADVYTRKTEPEKNLIDFSAYVLFFPQLIVGPIVRYRDMAQTLHTGKGRCTLQKAEDGAVQFVFGLAKKVILADSIGMLWQDIIAPDGGVGLANASTPLAWLGILAYSLQLYFDFAGYSEMSNGLSRMMGFECPANFNLPYMATSITDFWRRWHISLSMWFRDYVYIPLGGNRCSKGRQILNMLVVWALTGFWHGANWNFLCWGLYYFALLVIEKYLLRGVLQKGRGWQRVYTLFFVVLGWGIFTANAAGAPLGLLISRLSCPRAAFHRCTSCAITGSFCCWAACSPPACRAGCGRRPAASFRCACCFSPG